MNPSKDTPNSTAGQKPAGDTANAENTDSTTGTAPGAGEGQGNADTSADDSTDTDTADAPDKDGEGGEGEGDDAQQGAPEQYEAFTLPEGFALEGDRLELAHEFAKANNWTQEQAQQGVDTYLRFRAAELEHERGLWGAQSEEEFGKDFKAIATGAKDALAVLEKERPGITERLDATNLGNHPDVLFMAARIGKLAAAQPMHGLDNETSGADTPKDSREVMYPDLAKK